MMMMGLGTTQRGEFKEEIRNFRYSILGEE
jgi:hypothetical protein